MDPEDAAAPDAERGLVGVLHVIATRLRHPLFLLGLGAAILLTIIAVAGPEGGQTYAALLAGMILAVSVIWALTSRRSRAAPRGTTNTVRMGAFSRTRDIRQSSGGRGATNTVRGGTGAQAGNIDQGDPAAQRTPPVEP